jgi:protein lifeguard
MGMSRLTSDLTIRILFTQLLATTVVSGVFKGVPAVQTWVQANPWMMWVSLFGTIGTLIGLFVVRKKYPANFYLLAAFTYILSLWCLILVFLKRILSEQLSHSTTLRSSLKRFSSQLVCLLDLLSLHSNQNGISQEWDHSCLEDYGLLSSLASSCFSSLIMGILPCISLLIFRIVEVVYSAIGALIFSLYIIYDTYNICNVLHPDEYIVGAINL